MCTTPKHFVEYVYSTITNPRISIKFLNLIERAMCTMQSIGNRFKNVASKTFAAFVILLVVTSRSGRSTLFVAVECAGQPVCAADEPTESYVSAGRIRCASDGNRLKRGWFNYDNGGSIDLSSPGGCQLFEHRPTMLQQRSGCVLFEVISFTICFGKLLTQLEPMSVVVVTVVLVVVLLLLLLLLLCRSLLKKL